MSPFELTVFIVRIISGFERRRFIDEGKIIPAHTWRRVLPVGVRCWRSEEDVRESRVFNIVSEEDVFAPFER